MDHSGKFSTHSHLCSFINQLSHGLNHGRKHWFGFSLPQNSTCSKPSAKGKGIVNTHGYPWKLRDWELVKCSAAHLWWVASWEDWAAWSWIGSPLSAVERQLACESAEVALILHESHPWSFKDHQILQKGMFIYEKLSVVWMFYCFENFQLQQYHFKILLKSL